MPYSKCLPICLVAVLACSDGGFPVGPFTAEDCAQAPRQTHSGTVSEAFWRRANSPHLLDGSVVVSGTLAIEPGTLICGAEGSSLTAGHIVAEGAADSPIVFASVGAGMWGGINADSGTIRHSLIENTETAIRGALPEPLPLTVEDVHIVRTHGGAVRGVQTMRNVVIDSACIGGGGCGAVGGIVYRATTLENVVIRNSGGHGIVAPYRCSIVIDGGSIEGSAGVGIYIPWHPAYSCGLTVERPVRVTGGDLYPVIVPGSAVTGLLSSGSDLTGNGRDTLLIDGWYYMGDGEHRVQPELPWVVESRCEDLNTFSTSAGTIIVEAGASLTINAEHCILQADLIAEGTAADPAVIRGDGVRVYSRGLSADTIRLRHALLHGIRIRADSAPIIFEDVELHGSSLTLDAAGSRIDGLTGEGSAPSATLLEPDAEVPAVVTLGTGTSLRRAAITAGALDGVLVTGTDVTISECTITANVRHGIRVNAGSAVVRACNIHGNGAFGLSNATAITMEAVDNWWGDAAGPLAPAGDGVEGPVEYLPFRTTPVSW